MDSGKKWLLGTAVAFSLIAIVCLAVGIYTLLFLPGEAAFFDRLERKIDAVVHLLGFSISATIANKAWKHLKREL